MRAWTFSCRLQGCPLRGLVPLLLGLVLTGYALAADKPRVAVRASSISPEQAGNTKPGAGARPAQRKIRLDPETEPVPDDFQDAQPIDLGSALRLAGVENLELIQARQRVEVAVAVQQLAAAQILPNINIGTNFDSHTGNLQQA